MANSLDRQITLDGYRNAVVKLTGILDTGDAAEVPAIALSDFSGNDPSKTLVGLRVDLLEFAITNGLEVQLAWHGTNPQQMFPLSGRGRINSWNYGGFHPDMTRPGYNGSIDLTTTGFDAGEKQNFSIVLELIKLYA